EDVKIIGDSMTARMLQSQKDELSGVVVVTGVAANGVKRTQEVQGASNPVVEATANELARAMRLGYLRADPVGTGESWDEKMKLGLRTSKVGLPDSGQHESVTTTRETGGGEGTIRYTFVRIQP